MQELPDQVPVGHIPRSITVQCRTSHPRSFARARSFSKSLLKAFRSMGTRSFQHIRFGLFESSNDSQSVLWLSRTLSIVQSPRPVQPFSNTQRNYEEASQASRVRRARKEADVSFCSVVYETRTLIGGELTRVCTPGDTVRVSAVFLPQRYEGFKVFPGNESRIFFWYTSRDMWRRGPLSGQSAFSLSKTRAKFGRACESSLSRSRASEYACGA